MTEAGSTFSPARGGSVERSDLETLALSIVLVPLLWFVALGWTASQSAGAHDQIAQNLPLVRDLLENAHGDWRQFSYRAALLGGAKVHDVMGTLPLLQVFGWIGTGTLNALNGVLFCTQIACAFFGVRLSYDVARLCSGKTLEPRWLPRCGIVMLSAFSPTMAWKMTTGHHEEVFGALLGISLVALLLAQRNRTMSLTLVAMSVAVALQAFQTKGQELVYGAVFFGLVIIAAALPAKPARTLVVPLLVVVGSLALSLPKLAGMIAHVEGSDAARGLGAGSVVYSYVTATAHDWIASIPWGLTVIPLERDEVLWHEVNFGFGPLLVLLALLPWRKHRLLAAGLAISLVLPVLFSMNVPGVAWALTRLCPPLKAFRVPERSVLSFALVLPAFAAAALLMRPSRRRTRRWLVPVVGGTCGLLLFVAPSGLREVLAWALPLSIVLRPVFKWRLPARVPSGAILIALGLGSVGAFKERLRPFATEESLIESPAKLGAQIRSIQPELASPLARIVVHFDLDNFQTNTAYAMGLSSLSGYLNPPRRFLALEAALSGQEENVLRNYFRLDETVPSFPALSALYNVKYGAFPEQGKLRLSPLGDTAGAAWFSAAFTRVDSLTALANALHAVQGSLAAESHRQAWIVTGDEAVATADLPAVVDPECATASVTSVDAEGGEQSVHLHVKAPAACPLTVAMNYATDLGATSQGESLNVFPAYGALMGVWVPKGTSDVVVEAHAIVPPWARVLWFTGLAIVGLAFWETRRALLKALSSAHERAPEAPRPTPD